MPTSKVLGNQRSYWKMPCGSQGLARYENWSLFSSTPDETLALQVDQAGSAFHLDLAWRLQSDGLLDTCLAVRPTLLSFFSVNNDGAGVEFGLLDMTI